MIELKELRNSRDLRKLNEKLQNLVGLPVLRAELSYADELLIHMGDPRLYRHPKMADQQQGSWVFDAVATPWLVIPQGDIYSKFVFEVPALGLDKESRREIVRILGSLQGTK